MDCSQARGEKCEAALSMLQVKDETKMTVPELITKCTNLRRNFNCLLNYTSSCIAVGLREEKSRILSMARKNTFIACEDQDTIQGERKRPLNYPSFKAIISASRLQATKRGQSHTKSLRGQHF